MNIAGIDTASLLNNEVIVLITEWGMRVLSALAILVGGWVVGKHLARWVQRIKGLDSTLKSFLGGLLKYGIFSVSFVAVLDQFGVQTASLLAVLGAAGLAIGLALQGTLSNVAAGVMLLILRPFNVGDYIEIGNVKGTVRELGLFGTELSTLDNVYIFAPNSKIWNAEIFNFNRNTHRRTDLVFPIGNANYIDKAFKTFKDIIDADERLITTKEKLPLIFVLASDDASVNIGVRVWSKTSDHLAVKWDLSKEIKKAIEKEKLGPAAPKRVIEFADGATEDVAKKTAKKSG